MSNSSDSLDRASCMTSIVVKCTPDDAGNPVLKGLSLAISEVEDAPLNLVKSSQTMWKYNGMVEIPPSINQLSIMISSESAGNIGQIILEKQVWDRVVEDSNQSEICLERDFETNENFPKLSLSLGVRTEVMAEIALDELLLAVSILEDLNMLHSIMLRVQDDDPIKADGLNFCGHQFLKAFEVTHDKHDISKAIATYEKAAECLSGDDPRQWEFVGDIGLAYMSRYETWGEIKDLEKAIIKLRTAAEMTLEEHPDLPTRLNNFGMALSHNFKRTGQLVDICEAIRNMQRAVQLDPEGHPAFLNNLGQSLVVRFEHNGDQKDLSEAVGHIQRAIDLTPEGHPNLPAWLNNLGNAFSALFQRTGDLYAVSQAIENTQRAVHLTQKGHADLPAMLNNLGNSYSRRYKHSRQLADISEAIENIQRAVRLTPDGYATLPLMLNNLGNALLRRFERTGELRDVSEAIHNMQRAIHLIPEGHADLPRQLNNLGISFSYRFTRTSEIGDISEAIRNQRLAVKLTDGQADLPARLCNLGMSFLRRFERFGEWSDLSEATKSMEHAVRLTPEGHADLPAMLFSLGNSALLRFEHAEELSFITTAVSNYRLSAMSSAGSLAIRLEAAKLWATFSHQPLFPSSELLEAHERIIQLLTLITGMENTVQRRHETLVEYSRLSVAASTAALSVGRPDKALEWLAEGRCIVWNQLNQLRTPVDKLRAYDQALADRLSSLSIALENAGSRMDPHSQGTEPSMKVKISLQEEANSHIKLAKEWEELLSTIRSITGFEDFLRPRKCPDIMSGLPDDGPVVIINVHEERCDALALLASSNGPIHIPLPNFSLQQATQSVVDLRAYLSSYGVRMRLGVPLGDGDPSPPDDRLQKILNMLWSDVARPILGALAFSVPERDAKMPRIWWCPTGPLAFLPIHAAGVYNKGRSTPGQCLTDFIVSSYIPTLNILIDKSDSRSDIAEAVSGLLMISQAKTPGLADIPFAKEEVEKIQAQLATRGIISSVLDNQHGTVDRVLQSIESLSCVHLACHAFQHMTNPLKSAICLHDGRLELADIIKRKIPHADFAFMSACQTSKGDEKLTEEAVHLAAGMLAAGYRSVVGTMWSIFDKHGPDVAEFFYESLLNYTTNIKGQQKLDGRDAARSLHRATERLREKISDSPDSLLAWVPYIHVGV